MASKTFARIEYTIPAPELPAETIASFPKSEVPKVEFHADCFRQLCHVIPHLNDVAIEELRHHSEFIVELERSRSLDTVFNQVREAFTAMPDRIKPKFLYETIEAFKNIDKLVHQVTNFLRSEKLFEASVSASISKGLGEILTEEHFSVITKAAADMLAFTKVHIEFKSSEDTFNKTKHEIQKRYEEKQKEIGKLTTESASLTSRISEISETLNQSPQGAIGGKLVTSSSGQKQKIKLEQEKRKKETELKKLPEKIKRKQGELIQIAEELESLKAPVDLRAEALERLEKSSTALKEVSTTLAKPFIEKMSPNLERAGRVFELEKKAYGELWDELNEAVLQLVGFKVSTKEDGTPLTSLTPMAEHQLPSFRRLLGNPTEIIPDIVKEYCQHLQDVGGSKLVLSSMLRYFSVLFDRGYLDKLCIVYHGKGKEHFQSQEEIKKVVDPLYKLLQENNFDSVMSRIATGMATPVTVELLLSSLFIKSALSLGVDETHRKTTLADILERDYTKELSDTN